MLLHWIWLAGRKMTALQKRRLLEHFRDPEEIYYAEEDAFVQVEDMTQAVRDSLCQKDLGEAQAILDACRAKDIRLLTFGDAGYPSRLRSIGDAPVVLYYRGRLPDWDAMPAIGIVGTRKATPYGCNTARQLGRQVAACGALVVSGGAAGIDSMAMQGALDMGRPVVGVLGCGVDVIYPKSNERLFAQVLENGCLISEYPPQSSAFAWHFPERNRIIAGISSGLLVVEAPEKSGALITARQALEQGRDVFSVPGNLGVPNCVGTNILLQEGAKAVMSGWDVVKEYEAFYPGRLRRQDVPMTTEPQVRMVAQTEAKPLDSGGSKRHADKKSIDNQEKSTYSVFENPIPALSEAEQAVLACIDREGSLVDDVIVRSGQSPGSVKAILTKLALKKLVLQRPGGRVSLK